MDELSKLKAENRDLRYKLLVAQRFGAEAAMAADNPLTPWNLPKVLRDSHNYARKVLGETNGKD